MNQQLIDTTRQMLEAYKRRSERKEVSDDDIKNFIITFTGAIASVIWGEVDQNDNK